MEPIFIAPKIIDVWPAVTQSDRTWIRDIRYYGENWYDFSRQKLNSLETVFVRKMKAQANLDATSALAKILHEKGLAEGRVGIEISALNFSGHHAEIRRLQNLLPNISFVEASPIFREIRKIKTIEEIERLTKALAINETALQAAFRSLRHGNDISSIRTAVRTIIEKGGKPLSVAIAPSREFKSRNGYKIKPGWLIRNDFMIAYDGYCSDIARMAALGKPAEMLGRICNNLAKAVGGVIDLARPGVRVSDLYRQGISLANSMMPYAHGEDGPCLGHGIGICLGNSLAVCPHEDPWFVPTNDAVLEPGMVVNVEFPYNYLGVGVFNVEDTIQITKTGNKRLSKLSRELYIC
jgi:Xaa-Pro aminopeptidase